MGNEFTPCGGSFLLAAPAEVFSPDSFSDLQRMIAKTAEEFAQQEIASATNAIEGQDFGVIRKLLREAGRLGFTGVDVPEAFGGQGLDLATSAIVADHLAVLGSFSVAFGAHVGIATLPLVYFGTQEQKQRYLPRLASAEWVGAYALSEAGSGSDALALRASAESEADGSHFLLNGEKMWISNAGFADLFTVFARVEERVTAFLVEAEQPGVATGPEEQKMGIHGSSTRSLLLRNVRVSRSNVLGEIGGGAHVALHILNAGRFKLGAACVGGARNLLRETVAYAQRRHAFGQAIASFGLVRQMIGAMVRDIFAAESAVYRTAGLMAAESSLDEFAAECSMVKVHASEMLDRAADRAVQVHGGNGFVHGQAAERAYRDSRVNRIFEGTNEINRLMISSWLLRQAEKGKLNLKAAAEAVTEEMMSPAREQAPWEQARKATLLAAGIAHQRYGDGIVQQQEVLAMLADLMTSVYVMQSVAARRPARVVTETVIEGEMDASEMVCRQLLACVSDGDALQAQLAWMRRLFKRRPVNRVGLQRQLAEQALEAGGYPA